MSSFSLNKTLTIAEIVEASDSTVTFFSPPHVVLSVAGHYGTLPSTKTMGNISEHAVAHSIPTSPSHGSLALYSTFSLPRQQAAHNPNSPHSEVSSPVFRGDVTLDHRHKAHLAKVEGKALEFNNSNDTLFLWSTFHLFDTVRFTKDDEYTNGCKNGCFLLIYLEKIWSH